MQIDDISRNMMKKALKTLQYTNLGRDYTEALEIWFTFSSEAPKIHFHKVYLSIKVTREPMNW